MTDGQTASPALRHQTPKVDTDEGKHAREGRHRDDPEEQDLVARKVEGVGQEQAADRSRRPEGRNVTVPHDQRRHRAVGQRRGHRSHQVENDKNARPPQPFEDGAETPQNEHIDGHVPEFVVGEGGGDEGPQVTVYEARGADEEVDHHEIPETGDYGRRLPGEENQHVDADDHRHYRRA